MDITETLKFVLELSKTNRNKLAMIKTETALKSFLAKFKISPTSETTKSFKAVIPAIYKLQRFINEIDKETNIKEILMAPVTGDILKRYRNVPNFAKTMKNFETAPLYIRFLSNKAKVIAIRINENWKSPKKDLPLVVKNRVTLITFNEFRNKFIEFEIEQLKTFLKTDNLSDIPETTIKSAQTEIKYDSFQFEDCLTNIQAYEIFKILYKFDPTKSNNNGLYVLVLELKEKFFKSGSRVPVHEVKTVETKLSRLGISKDNSNPNIFLKFKKLDNKIFYFDLMIDDKVIDANIKITITNQLVQFIRD